jgi:hypothetical protein
MVSLEVSRSWSLEVSWSLSLEVSWSLSLEVSWSGSSSLIPSRKSERRVRRDRGDWLSLQILNRGDRVIGFKGYCDKT